MVSFLFAAFSPLLAHVSVGAHGLEPTSPSSVLPTAATLLVPASPTGNATCTFEDRNSLIDRVVEDWAGYNVSLLVQTCPGVCTLVYGVGNPDISGIGAMISYVLQGITSLLFGPLLWLTSLYVGSSDSEDDDTFFQTPEDLWVTEYFGPAATTIQQANILVAFSVFAASVVRLQDVTPLAEKTFLTSLSHYQLTAAIICTISYMTIHKRSSLKTFAVVIYMIAAFLMFLVVASPEKNTFPAHQARVLQAITAFCIKDYDWPVTAIPEHQEEHHSRPPLDIDQLHPALRVLVLPLLFVCGVVLSLVFKFVAGIIVEIILFILGMICLFIYRRLSQLYYALCQATHLSPMRFGGILLIALTGILSALLISMTLFELFRQRTQLQKATGGEYADNQWGFGQVMSVMAWVPVVQDILISIIGATRYLKERPRLHHNSALMHELQPLASAEQQLEGLARASSLDQDQLPYYSSTGEHSSQLNRGGARRQTSPASNTDGTTLPTPTLAACTQNGNNKNQTDQEAESPSRPSSVDVMTGVDLDRSTTWPRNERGTYLPMAGRGDE